jgi:hypothetical protein
MGEALTVVKAVLELGALGVLLVFSVRMWWKWTDRFEVQANARIQSEKDHSKELMKLQAEHNRELTSLVRDYENTLNTVIVTLRRLTGE